MQTWRISQKMRDNLALRPKMSHCFTATMADLDATTNLTADSASSDFAKFANITNLNQSLFENMGSSVVELGNNLATTEQEIVSMAMRIAAAGTQAGMTPGEDFGRSRRTFLFGIGS